MPARPRRGRARSRRAALLLCLLAALPLLAAADRPGHAPASAPVPAAPAVVPGTTHTPTDAAPGEEPRASGISVVGTRLRRDGEPWLPRGFNMVGLLSPAWCATRMGAAAREHYGSAELSAARSWGADTLRFQVSQRGLANPALTDADRAAYLAHVLDGVALARARGFAVIVSMQDQSIGCGDVHPMPSEATLDAWTVLAPPLADDPHVLLELFNEPQNEADPAGWAQWRDGGPGPMANLGDVAVGHQALVDHLRALGSRQVLIADAARLGERTTGLPLLADPLGATAYAIHPYFFDNGPRWWERHYGDLAAVAPVIATEWNYLAADCGTAKERLAPALLDHLRRNDIGMLGHAFDVLGRTVADWSWNPTRCGTASGGSGAVLKEYFASLDEADGAQQPAR